MLVRFNERRGLPLFAASRSFPPSGLPVVTLRRELDRLFGDLERTPAFAAHVPAARLDDLGESFRVQAELPGLTEKDLEIDVTASTLTVKALRRVEPPAGYTAHRQERRSFSFNQSYELPSRVDPERVEASLRQGVLTLTLPKVSEAQPRKVTVNAAA